MTIKVAINGFGRIGRLAFRQLYQRPEFEIVAINDLTNPTMLAHLLKFDSTQGRFSASDQVHADDESISIADVRIPVFAETDAAVLPWQALAVDIVLECTGFYTSTTKAQAHINAGAKKVIISAPAGNDLPTIVYGVNESTLTAHDTIISAASCTTNCLAPVANTLNCLVPIVKGSMTTIHAYTGDQNTLDAPHRKGDLRRARAAGLNIVPTSSGAAKAVGLVVPALAGKLDGVSQRVPVPAGSLAELVAVVDGVVDTDQVNAAMHSAQSDAFGYNEDLIVSSDIIGMTYGSLFDATQTKTTTLPNNQTLVKVVAWYDNENSFVSQMVRTLGYFGALL